MALASRATIGQSDRMLVTASDAGYVTITVTRSELALINGALNEVCNGVRELGHDGEFSARLGRSREEAKQLLADVHAALRE